MSNNIEGIRKFIPENLNLVEMNAVLITLDSCRLDSAFDAKMPWITALFGKPLEAHTLSTYTPASHTAMWLGHLPSTKDNNIPYCNEPTKQLWRLVTGPARDADKGCGILFEGNNVIDGFNKLDFHTQGIGGVSQFSTGSFLRSNFPWDNFEYFGPDMDEEPLAARESKLFPLNHIEEITNKLKEKNKFFCFINCPETHYPYDWGEGIDEQILNEAFPLLKQSLNLRSLTAPNSVVEELASFSRDLHNMQVKGLEVMDSKLHKFFKNIKKISNNPLYVVIVGDHGENFGEIFQDNRLFGHMHPTQECTNVPMWMGVI